MNNEQLAVIHNAARLLQNAAYSRMNKEVRKECAEAAHALYRTFGEPPEPMTSAGGNCTCTHTDPNDEPGEQGWMFGRK